MHHVDHVCHCGLLNDNPAARNFKCYLRPYLKHTPCVCCFQFCFIFKLDLPYKLVGPKSEPSPGVFKTLARLQFMSVSPLKFCHCRSQLRGSGLGAAHRPKPIKTSLNYYCSTFLLAAITHIVGGQVSQTMHLTNSLLPLIHRLCDSDTQVFGTMRLEHLLYCM